MTRRIGTLTASLALATAGSFAATGCASVMTAWQQASNRDMTSRIAPALVSTVWIHPQGEVPTPEYDGRWTMLVFLDPAARATLDQLPTIREASEKYRKDGVVVFGIIESDLEKTTFFLEDHPVNFSVVANAHSDRVAFGIKNLYEPVIYLVDPYQRILTSGLEQSLAMLREKHGR